jgi:hypothetical protein
MAAIPQPKIHALTFLSVVSTYKLHQNAGAPNMLRYLAISGLLFGVSALADSVKVDKRLSPEVRSFIEQAKANGLTEVNNGPYNGKDRRYRDSSGLSYTAPPGGWVPNPETYKDRKPSGMPEFFYRTVRDCKSNRIIDEQVIFTYNGYQNYIPGSRYEEQCVLDGSADTFYEDSDARLK